MCRACEEISTREGSGVVLEICTRVGRRVLAERSVSVSIFALHTLASLGCWRETLLPKWPPYPFLAQHLPSPSAARGSTSSNVFWGKVAGINETRQGRKLHAVRISCPREEGSCGSAIGDAESEGAVEVRHNGARKPCRSRGHVEDAAGAKGRASRSHGTGKGRGREPAGAGAREENNSYKSKTFLLSLQPSAGGS